MPVTPIRRLNKEHLRWGILPEPWFLAFLPIVIPLLLMGDFRVGPLLIRAVIGLGLLALMVAAHRVSRARIITHWIWWNASKRGGVLGRDLLPIPHTYQEMDEEAQTALIEQYRADQKQSRAWKQQRQQAAQRDKQSLQRAQAAYQKQQRHEQRAARQHRRP